MKRLVWLVLLAFGTALAQVQPVEAVGQKSGPCGCYTGSTAGTCDHAAAQGMDSCVPCTTCTPTLNSLLPANLTLSVAGPAEIARLHWRAAKGRELAYPPLLTPPRRLG